MKLQPFLNNLYKYHIHYAHCKADIVSRVKISMILCVLIGTRSRGTNKYSSVQYVRIWHLKMSAQKKIAL